MRRPLVPRSLTIAWLLAVVYLQACLSMLAGQRVLVRFAVIGDSGSGDKHQYRVATQMAAWHGRLPYDLVLMLGDNIYGSLLGRGGTRKDFEKQFDRPYATLLARGVVFRAALGNHDTEHREGKELIEASARFHIAGPQGYYRFSVGEWRARTRASQPGGSEKGAAPLVEFFVLNTTRLVEGKQDPEQLTWLERTLAASQARWRVVYGHHPLYSTGRHHGGDAQLRAALEPILQGTRPSATPAASEHPARVRIVFAGHDHIYQRFHPQKDIVYFVCGSSGKLRRGDARPSPEVAAINDQQHVFVLWEATPEALRFQAINEQGEAFDCGVIGRAATVQSVACSALAGIRPAAGAARPKRPPAPKMVPRR